MSSLESFSRLSQSIKDAAEATSIEDKAKAQKAATLVVNSVGVMSTPKRTARPTAFSEAVDTLGDAIKTARDAKQAKLEAAVTDKPEAKTLAQLLVEAQDEE